MAISRSVVRLPQIRVLVVDDSYFMRKRLVEMLSADPDIHIIGIAESGLEALEKAATLKPDVITLDIEMANMDGLTALSHIMRECPTSVVMVSTLTEAGSEATVSALMSGAVDFVHKPTNFGGAKLDEVRYEIIAKVKAASSARPARARNSTNGDVTRKERIKLPTDTNKLVMIGSSTGGPKALIEVLPRLPKDFPLPIAIVQHMPPGPFIKSIAKRLEAESAIKVREAQNGDRLEPGLALMAPGGYHMLIEKGGLLKLNNGPSVNSVKPSVDVMMSSAAAVYGSGMVGVILTGMGRDGADGMALIKKRGGRTIAEHESTCVVYGMPKSVIDAGNADSVVPLERITQEIVRAVGGAA